MNKKLRYNSKFVPVSIDAGNEYMANGIFIFNITKMTEHINKNPQKYECRKISVEAYRNSFYTVNEEYLPEVDLSVPVILAEIRPGTYNCIDGRHRLERAYRDGIKELDAYLVSSRQHMKFMATKEGYKAYVAYYNSKIDDDERDARRRT